MCPAVNDKYNHKKCRHRYLVYKDSEHVKEGEEGSGILGSLGEFCGAFYHTPEVPYPNKIKMVCLDPSTCQIGRGRKSSYQPKTAVALVKYEIDGKKFLKRYTNCHEKQAHAEEYFKYDITEGRLKKLSRQISEKATGEITMYITMQPCNLSTHTKGTPKEYSCCTFLHQIMGKLPKGIEICIKPTHLCKAGWTKQSKTRQVRQEIENAEEGLKDLMRSNPRITFAAMTEDDWDYLWKHVNVPADLQLEVAVERKALDKDIRGKLKDWKEETEKQAVDEMSSTLGNITLNKKPQKKK